ncbi:MAG: ArnT family glycosyltransferase [Flavobacteriales bacterium]
MTHPLKTKPVLLILLGFFVIRFLVCILMGIQPQDAYYTYYADHLDLSYFDHPPMIAYFVKLSITLFGKHAAVVKLGDLFWSTFTLYFFYLLAGHFLSYKRQLYATLIFGSSLLLSLVSIITTPDVPLLFFWTLTLLAILKALEKDRFWHWMLVGLLIALTFDSKYTGLILGACLVLFLLVSNQHRTKLFSYRPLVAFVVFLIGISPVILWNIEHDFASIKFQSSGRASAISTLSLMKPTNLLGFFGSQAALINFVSFGLLLKAFWIIVKNLKSKLNKAKEQQLFLVCFSLPLFLIFALLSPIYWVKVNWIMPVYICGIILASYLIKPKGIKWTLGIGAVLHILGLIQVIWVPIPIKSDDTWVGWETLVEEIEPYSKAYPDHFFFADDHYKTSSILNFYSNDRYYYGGNIIEHFALQYSMIDDDLSYLKGQNAIMIDSESRDFVDYKEHKMIDDLFCFFEKVIELEPIYVRDSSGKIIKKFVVRECINFHPEQVPEEERSYIVY